MEQTDLIPFEQNSDGTDYFYDYRSDPMLEKLMQPKERMHQSQSSLHQSRTRREVWIYQRGIIDECCKNPCTLATLLSYCSVY